jgi:quercetin dioxygenase-like cupin family protein
MRTASDLWKAALLLVAISAVAQQPPVVELTHEPSHHQVFENKYLRVFDVTVAPKATTLVHRHDYDYLFVTLGDADITNAKVGAQPVQAKFKDGDVRFTPGKFAHAAVNNLPDRPFHNITIELLNPTTGEANCKEGCTVSVPCPSADKANCPTVQRLLSSDQWEVVSLTLPPGAAYEARAYANSHFTVAVSELDLKVNTQDGHEATIHQKIGEVAWRDPATVSHTLTNVGSKPAVFVAIEMKNTAAPKTAAAKTFMVEPAQRHDSQ